MCAAHAQPRTLRACVHAGIERLIEVTPSSSIFVRVDDDNVFLWRALITGAGVCVGGWVGVGGEDVHAAACNMLPPATLACGDRVYASAASPVLSHTLTCTRGRRCPGPEDTPYSGGCFLFDIFFPPNYPGGPPKVGRATTAAAVATAWQHGARATHGVRSLCPCSCRCWCVRTGQHHHDWRRPRAGECNGAAAARRRARCCALRHLPRGGGAHASLVSCSATNVPASPVWHAHTHTHTQKHTHTHRARSSTPTCTRAARCA
jgi:hypothetical protein